MLRATIVKFAMDAAEQIKDPDIGECFDWDPSYVMVGQWCEELGWVSVELRVLLDQIDALLDQLSDDHAAWSDEAINTHPFWQQVRAVAREAICLMPEEPWTSQLT